MYLKSIEMQGFKSFADKILLEFNDGVTGIVGPNGSGKSNIADAVRWVLGEQSAKQLRGSNMQDVIFSGTENRKAVSFASVTLTLSNADRLLAVDYDDVILARRVYRSGESEYLLNGSSCRLKDIQELLYDTGIGKEGYSIIGQGQIDKILSGKPEERRELFDEAAGIVKFKKRKNLAQKKLENEHLNLLRVSDILAELEKQVGPLARQSEKARQYLRLKENGRESDLLLFAANREKNEKRVAELSEKQELVQNDLAGSRRRTEGLKEEYDQVLVQGQELENELYALQNQIAMLRLECETREGEIRLLEEQVSHIAESDSEKRERLTTIAGEIRRRRAERESLRLEREQLSGQAELLLAQRAERQTLWETQEEEEQILRHQIGEEQSAQLSLLNKKAALEARAQRYEAMLEQNGLRRSEIQEKLLHARTEEEQRQKEEERLTSTFFEVSGNAEELKKEEALLTEQEKTVAEKRELARGKLSQLSQQYDKTRARWESLQNIAERYEGFGGSTRRIMEEKGRFPGVRGTVSDLVRTDPRYELAMETALGGSIQNIVTIDESTAKDCISYLKENRLGRSTFLPLENLQAKSFPSREALRERGVIGIAGNLLTAPPEMDVLPSYLLGNVLLVENLDCALAIARKYHYDFRIVTLEGDLLNRGGSLTGGAFKNNSNLLGRKRELEELEKLCMRRKKEETQAKEELADISERLKKIRDRRDLVRSRLVQVRLQLKEVELNASALEDRRRSEEAGSQDLNKTMLSLADQSEETKRLYESVSCEIAALRSEEKQTGAMLSALQEKLLLLQKDKFENQRELSENNAGLAGLSQRERALEDNEERLLAEEEQLLREETECCLSLTENQAAQEEKTEKKELLLQQIREQEQKRETLEQSAKETGELRSRFAEKQKHFMQQRDQLAAEESELEKESLRLLHQREKLEESIEEEAGYIWSEYELTPSEALALARRIPEQERPSHTELRKRISEIRSEMKNLGPVNVNAIEEYREVSERYEFMKAQHEDLTRAEESLQRIIEELDEGMKRQFREKFEEIRREFDRVFGELFGGGRATMELQDPEDILGSGIQIIAQPPGKKLVNLMQMSGGEKALTAISILFAIQNLKPSPFCLLDEIEAALDDVNVTRFAEYLKKLVKNTQFITITHRRGTMLAADRLYGITMQEKGISALVSVDMTDE